MPDALSVVVVCLFVCSFFIGRVSLGRVRSVVGIVCTCFVAVIIAVEPSNIFQFNVLFTRRENEIYNSTHTHTHTHAYARPNSKWKDETART